MSEALEKSSLKFETPRSEITTKTGTEPKKSVKRAITSPILIQFSHPAKKTKAKSASSVSEESDISDLSNMAEETMAISEVEASQLVSVPMQPDDISRIAFELRPIMVPEMRELVKDDLAALIDRAVKAINDTTKSEISSLKSEISALKTENASLRAENESLAAKVTSLEKRVVTVEQASDMQEQYSRRNCLRISGVPEKVNENTDQLVLSLAEELNVQLVLSDIDRSHRVGKQTRGGRKIIVKFTTYRARQNLFSQRKKLSETTNWSGVFINEDLTARRSKLLFDARQLKRAKKLRAAYSSGGKIVVIDNSDVRHVIESENDIEVFKV